MIVYFVARLSSHEILLVLLNILELLKHLSFILICGYMKISTLLKLLFAQNGRPNYVSYQRAITPVKIVTYNFPYYTVFINRQIQPRLKKILNKNIVYIVNLKVFFKSKRSREFEFSSNVAKLFQLQCQSQNCLKLHMVERAYSNLKKNEAICMTSNYLNKNNISMRNFSII